MINCLRPLILIGVLLILFSSCKKKTQVERAFYYWKNRPSSLTDHEFSAIQNNNIRKLYVKFFDVVPDEVFTSIPIAKTSLHPGIKFNYLSTKEDTLYNQELDSLSIIPTVFIKNDVLLNARKGSLDTLADNITYLIGKYYREKYSYLMHTYTEIQIDCDWTPKSKDNYFYLLQKIKSLSTKQISCTLRLYPYKYRDKMGIPPVDKVTLMCYNLISPLKEPDKNSILDTDELLLYLKGADPYPLHLDIALPVFEWAHLYQNNKFVGLIEVSVEDTMYDFHPMTPMWYEVKRDMEAGNHYLKPGDQVKLEQISEETIYKTISILKQEIDFGDTVTVSLYHLDDQSINKYKNESFGNFYTAFTK